jgi:hypothetical protein
MEDKLKIYSTTEPEDRLGFNEWMKKFNVSTLYFDKNSNHRAVEIMKHYEYQPGYLYKLAKIINEDYEDSKRDSWFRSLGGI